MIINALIIPMRFPIQKIAGRAFRASNPTNNQVRCLLGVRRICASRNAFPATKETLKMCNQRSSFLSSSSLVCAIGNATGVPQIRNNSHKTPKLLKIKHFLPEVSYLALHICLLSLFQCLQKVTDNFCHSQHLITPPGTVIKC